MSFRARRGEIMEEGNSETTQLDGTYAVSAVDSESYAAETQRAVLNILEDFNEEKSRLENTQRAVLNILDDLNQSNEELQKARDVLEQRVIERTAELQSRTDQLARSNAELEQFAYVASHDLQEPLRMISSYVQLLQDRYRGKLDADADDFINYASDGALRMQRLINDLLQYSRVGTRGKAFEEIGLEPALEQALTNLQVAIGDSGANITHDALPAAYGDIGQLTQVFQNLIDNAIKFRGERRPRVHVSARVEATRVVCSVSDNGIGIPPEYRDRLFVLFQRLHTRKEYPGTGLGLAICKRIIERHGGRIWIESSQGNGSTFFFTVPTKPRS